MRMLPTLRRRGAGLPSWRDIDLLEDPMQRMFGTPPRWEPFSETFGWAPRVDLADENGQLVLTAEIPGIEPEDVDIEVEGNMLTIRGEKKIEREEKGEHIRLAERRYGAFERTFTLPSSADPEKVDAEFHQGVLKLKVAKRPEARGRKIQVKAK